MEKLCENLALECIRNLRFGVWRSTPRPLLFPEMQFDPKSYPLLWKMSSLYLGGRHKIPVLAAMHDAILSLFWLSLYIFLCWLRLNDDQLPNLLSLESTSEEATLSPSTSIHQCSWYSVYSGKRPMKECQCPRSLSDRRTCQTVFTVGQTKIQRLSDRMSC